MHLSEFVFQGPFDCRTPVRIKSEQSVEKITLPPGMRIEDFHDLLTTVLYPSHTSSSLRHQLSQGESNKIAAVFSSKNRRYRITRRNSTDSLRIQAEKDEEFVDVARGKKEVESYLTDKLNLPNFETFWTLNLWRFDSSPKTVTGLDADLLDDRIRKVVMKYRLALKAENIEDRMKALESEIKDVRKRLGKGIKLEDKLQKAQQRLREVEVTQLSEKELLLLQNKDVVTTQILEQIDRLEVEKEDANYQLDKILPASPRKNPMFWLSTAIGLTAIIVAALKPEFRLYALLDIPAFGLSIALLFKYFSQMERASIHLVRLDSIKRRLAQVKEEKMEVNEKLNHLLIHANVQDVKELSERVSITERLSGVIEQMKAKVDALRNDPEYLKASGTLIEKEHKLETIQQQRKDLPKEVMSSYQLEVDLQSMGVDPAALRDKDTSEVSEVSEPELDPFERILEAARQTSQYSGNVLHERTQKMWLKITAHVLGERFGNVSIKNSKLSIGALGDDQMKMWMRTRPSEYQVLLASLAFSIQVNALRLSKRGAFSTVIISDFSKSLTGTQPKRLTSVFESAGQRTNVLLCESA